MWYWTLKQHKQKKFTLNSNFLIHVRKETKTKPACHECRGLLLFRSIIEFLAYSFSSLLHTEHLHLLVSINRFPTASYMFHKAAKKFTKIRTVLFEFYYTDSHHHTPFILLPKVLWREGLSITCPPFCMLHLLCSIPSAPEHNLQESLQVQLHLTRKRGEEYLSLWLFSKATLYSDIQIRTRSLFHIERT